MQNIEFEPLLTADGLPNVKIRLNDKSATLHSTQPHKEAERIVSRFNKELKTVVLAGLGLGYTAEWILNNTDFNLLIYEAPEAVLEQTQKYKDQTPLFKNPRVKLFQGDPQNLLDYLGNNGIRELNFSVSRPYITLFPEIFFNLEGLLIAFLSQKQINQATLKRFQKVWLKNILKNSSWYFKLPGVSHIRHEFRKKPAVIVGAGPSLGKNIHLLREYQSSLLIIATDTALSLLMANGIKPDFVVSVDPQDKNTQYLLYAFGDKPALVIDSAASFISFVHYPVEKTILYDTIFPLYDELTPFWGKKGKLLCGGSVSTTAFDLARFLQCDPIIFTGQDLAFSGKATHVRGSILEDFLYSKINRIKTYDNYNTRMLLSADKIEIESSDGGKVPTDRKFLTFLDWFKREIAATEAKVINCSEGGAFIKGCEHLPLKEAMEKYRLQVPFQKKFSVDFQPSNPASFVQFLQATSETIEALITPAAKAKQSARELGLDFSRIRDTGRYFNAMNQFDRALLESIRQRSQVGRFIEFTMQHSIEKILQSGENQTLTQELVSHWAEFYQEAYFGLLFIRRLVKKSLSLFK